jgi:DEP domain-containing protein 5
MKYWRYRMYLLPKDDLIMKRIIDENIERCDIYVHENSPSVVKQQIEEFHRFVETHLNRIRRLKKPRVRKPVESFGIRTELTLRLI